MKKTIVKLGGSFLIGILALALSSMPAFAADAEEYCSAAYQLDGGSKSYSDAKCAGESNINYWSCVYKQMSEDGESLGYAKGWCHGK